MKGTADSRGSLTLQETVEQSLTMQVISRQYTRLGDIPDTTGDSWVIPDTAGDSRAISDTAGGSRGFLELPEDSRGSLTLQGNSRAITDTAGDLQTLHETDLVGDS